MMSWNNLSDSPGYLFKITYFADSLKYNQVILKHFFKRQKSKF